MRSQVSLTTTDGGGRLAEGDAQRISQAMRIRATATEGGSTAAATRLASRRRCCGRGRDRSTARRTTVAGSRAGGPGSILTRVAVAGKGGSFRSDGGQATRLMPRLAR